MHRRVGIGCPAQLIADEASLRATCVDLSGGGLGLHVDCAVELGAVVRVSVALPNGREVRTQAQIVRVDGQRKDLGLRFLRLDPRSLSAILSCVATSSTSA